MSAVPSPEFQAPENDHVVVSRQGQFVDLSGALRGSRPLLGARRVDSPEQATEVFDSEKGEAESAGLARRDVLTDTERW